MGKRAFSKSQIIEKMREWGFLESYYLVVGARYWKEAVYIAWAAQPKRKRNPFLAVALANALGYADESIFRKWKAKEGSDIKEEIKRLVGQRLGPWRADVLEALINCAVVADPKYHPDRKLFLEMIGDYTPKMKQEITEEIALKTYIGISPDDWDKEKA